MNVFHSRFSLVASVMALGSYLCKHAGDHSVTTEACSSPHLTFLGFCGMESLMQLSALCINAIDLKQNYPSFADDIFLNAGAWILEQENVFQMGQILLTQHWYG